MVDLLGACLTCTASREMDGHIRDARAHCGEGGRIAEWDEVSIKLLLKELRVCSFELQQDCHVPLPKSFQNPEHLMGSIGLFPPKSKISRIQ